MPNFVSMYQYKKDVFSVIHPKNITVEIGDEATVFHKTSLRKQNRNTRNLPIVEVLETRAHKTDDKSLITIVRCEEQN